MRNARAGASAARRAIGRWCLRAWADLRGADSQSRARNVIAPALANRAPDRYMERRNRRAAHGRLPYSRIAGRSRPLASSKIVPGIDFNTTGTLIAAALLLGIVNAFVRPIIIILTLPDHVAHARVVPARHQCADDHACRLVPPWLPGRRVLVGGLRCDHRQPDKLGHVRLDRPARPGRSHNGSAARRARTLVSAFKLILHVELVEQAPSRAAPTARRADLGFLGGWPFRCEDPRS